MTTSNHARTTLNSRLQRSSDHILNARTVLHHFALINYAVPKERLRNHIPDNFEIPEFDTENGRFALMSAVPFIDFDFHFPWIFPQIQFKFPQTNHRVYVIDKKTQEHAVWFFGTNLGSRIVHIPQILWGIPWYYTTYSTNFNYNQSQARYEAYSYHFHSEWCQGDVEIEDTGIPIHVLKGFQSMDEMKLILTHPVTGYFHRLDGKLGTYRIWHPEMQLTQATPKHLYFSLYENLGLLSKQEMQSPHSIFVSPQIEFEIYLPPQVLKENKTS